MKRSLVIAVVLAVAAAGWIASGTLGDESKRQEARKPPATVGERAAPASVRTRVQQAEEHVTHLVVRGRTEASRNVLVKSEARGRVAEVLVEKGERVTVDQPIVRLEAEDREARLAQALALREQRRIEYEASKTLSKKGYRAETQLAAAKAAFDAAEAAVQSAQVAINNLTVRAPYDGVLDSRGVELGDFLDIGDVVGRVVDLDPILGVAEVSERDVGALELGQRGELRLVAGPAREGILSFISKAADPATRTFRVEMEVTNTDAAIPDGMTAELDIPVKTVMAHKISPAILTLSDDGDVGVKLVDQDERVRFVPVRIIEDGPNGTWVAGAPQTARFIVVGQEFVVDGERVRAMPSDEVDDTPAVTGRDPDAAS